MAPFRLGGTGKGGAHFSNSQDGEAGLNDSSKDDAYCHGSDHDNDKYDIIIIKISKNVFQVDIDLEDDLIVKQVVEELVLEVINTNKTDFSVFKSEDIDSGDDTSDYYDFEINKSFEVKTTNCSLESISYTDYSPECSVNKSSEVNNSGNDNHEYSLNKKKDQVVNSANKSKQTMEKNTETKLGNKLTGYMKAGMISSADEVTCPWLQKKHNKDSSIFYFSWLCLKLAKSKRAFFSSNETENKKYAN
ncbi:uncharacterized protein LOC105844121 [Hydra vulgaris]|uniref:uncharacterized protein LOC105844121 n=1 Tax=Hydra vulgaris TaxID=6087 RepID=UPI001F5F3621|nr:uncharacterized protein LOC105844121 [Hydra vulgaris]